MAKLTSPRSRHVGDGSIRIPEAMQCSACEASHLAVDDVELAGEGLDGMGQVALDNLYKEQSMSPLMAIAPAPNNSLSTYGAL